MFARRRWIRVEVAQEETNCKKLQKRKLKNCHRNSVEVTSVHFNSHSSMQHSRKETSPAFTVKSANFFCLLSTLFNKRKIY